MICFYFFKIFCIAIYLTGDSQPQLSGKTSGIGSHRGVRRFLLPQPRDHTHHWGEAPGGTAGNDWVEDPRRKIMICRKLREIETHLKGE